MKKNVLFFVFAVLVQTSLLHAQDIHFSQFNEVSLLRNPALTGLFNGDYKAAAHYRSQWGSISQPFVTGMATAELKRKGINDQDFIGIGINGFFDRSGSIALSTLSGNFAFSYHKLVSPNKNGFLSLAALGGYIQRKFDPSKITTGSQYIPGQGFDPSNPLGETFENNRYSQFDVGFGVNYSQNTGDEDEHYFSVGAAVYHLTKPETGFGINALKGIRQDMRFNANALFNHLISEKYSYQLLGNISLHGPHRELNVGGLFCYTNDAANGYNVIRFSGGLFYRLADAIVPVVKLDYNQLSVGLSYDLNSSKLRTASQWRGGTEITMSITGLFTDPNGGFTRTVCPKR